MATLHERTPLLQSNGARSPTTPTTGEQGDPTRLIADAVARISSVSLDPEVIQDILTTESTLGQGYSPTDYGYALTVLLSYREQKVKQQTAPELDLYGQWTQEQTAHKDAEALDKLVGTLWGQFLLHYRTDKEVDAVLWSQFSQDATSGVVLKGTVRVCNNSGRPYSRLCDGSRRLSWDTQPAYFSSYAPSCGGCHPEALEKWSPLRCQPALHSAATL